MRVWCAVLAVAALVAGCGAGEEGSGAGVVLDPQQGCGAGLGVLEVPGEVAPGDQVALAVENVTEGSTLTFGLSGRLERAGEGGWEPADDAVVARPIPELALVLRPGETTGAASDLIELTDDAEPGAYRALKDVTATGRGANRAEQATLCAGFTVGD